MSEIYLIEVNDFSGSTLAARYFPEQKSCDATRAVEAIRSGAHENVNRVVAIDLERGTARDATREIGQAILDDLDEAPAAFLENFLQEALGVGTVNRALSEMSQ